MGGGRGGGGIPLNHGVLYHGESFTLLHHTSNRVPALNFTSDFDGPVRVLFSGVVATAPGLGRTGVVFGHAALLPPAGALPRLPEDTDAGPDVDPAPTKDKLDCMNSDMPTIEPRSGGRILSVSTSTKMRPRCARIPGFEPAALWSLCTITVAFFEPVSKSRQHVRIANNSQPPKVAHPHPIDPATLFANSSPPSNRGSFSITT